MRTAKQALETVKATEVANVRQFLEESYKLIESSIEEAIAKGMVRVEVEFNTLSVGYLEGMARLIRKQGYGVKVILNEGLLAPGYLKQPHAVMSITWA